MKNQNNQLNVLFSADDNYAQHLGAAIYSLLASNTDFQIIQIFVVDNAICQKNKEKLFEIVNIFNNANLELIDFSEIKNNLHLEMHWNISISAYARLFITDLLPQSIERILYLDCDMIIIGSLTDLWNTELDGNIIAAVQDAVSDYIKTSVDVLPDQQYFNSGMLLIDCKKWARHNISEKCMSFLKDKNGSVIHHDQGVLNGILNNYWRRVGLQYNVMTIHYFFNLNQINKYYHNHADFYSEDEIIKAKNRPIIIHYTPSFTTRPWIKNCKHPLKKSIGIHLKKHHGKTKNLKQINPSGIFV